MNNYVIIGCAVALFGFGYGVADYKASVEFTEYKLAAEQKQNALEDEIEALNKENENLVRSMEQEAIEQLTEQKETYEKIIDDLRTRLGTDGVFIDSRNCSDLPRTSEDSRGFVCYTESDLHRKIEKSLAIAHEADQLAVKYATVLKIVEGQNAKK